MIPIEWLFEAAERIAPHVLHTPLQYLPRNDIYLKLENHQVTGSFKTRGAINKVLTLQEWERKLGLVAASAGNHGQGVALAGNLVNAKATIFASEQAVPAKIEAMRALGAEVRLVRGGYGEAEEAGLAYAKENGVIWISPYNDGQVIAGQGTLGLEIGKDLPLQGATTWVVPAGGGGLVAGIGVAIQNLTPRPHLIAVQSEASSFLHSLYHKDTQADVVELDSLADGLAGPVEDGSLTIPLVKKYVDDFILVSEEEIYQAIAEAWQQYHERIEGSAAVALAAVLYGKVKKRPAVVVISGGNIQPEIHKKIVGNG